MLHRDKISNNASSSISQKHELRVKFQELEHAKTDLLFNFELISQESKLGCFHEGIGVCEQIIGTPIPLSYTRLTSRFLVLWHLTLPVILWDDCHWIVVPATFISAASLFCIEEVITLFAFSAFTCICG